MSQKESISISGHPNIYTGGPRGELRIDFALPTKGTNDQTGILLIAPGFGGNIDAKVYQKMLVTFPDEYNVITVMADYFGSKFMQGPPSYQLKDQEQLKNIFTQDELELLTKDSSQLLGILGQQERVLRLEANLGESMDDFCDMCYMQAIDLATGVEAVKLLLEDNQLAYHPRRLIGYGHSHGAYLLHLYNTLVPGYFSYIIDNSAWIIPQYLLKDRILVQEVGQAKIHVHFSYLAKKVFNDVSDINLFTLYSQYKGNTQYLVYQGTDDHLIDYKEKQALMEEVRNTKLILVDQDQVDGEVITNHHHGLGADFLKMFRLAMVEEAPAQGESYPWQYELVYPSFTLKVHNEGLPIFAFTFN